MKLPTASGGVSSGIAPKPTRLRSSSYGAVHLAIHPCGKPQGILAKANKFHKVYNLMFPDKAVEKGFEVRMLVDEAIKLNYDLNIMDRKTIADYGAELKTIDLILEDFHDLPSYPRTTTREDWKKIMIKVMNGEYMLK